VVHYLMLVNYFWMFCEGLHLHLVLVVVSQPKLHSSHPFSSYMAMQISVIAV